MLFSKKRLGGMRLRGRGAGARGGAGAGDHCCHFCFRKQGGTGALGREETIPDGKKKNKNNWGKPNQKQGSPNGRWKTEKKDFDNKKQEKVEGRDKKKRGKNQRVHRGRPS